MPHGQKPAVQDHALDRESGSIVYPVLSRRSGGLSIGIDLHPSGKACNFDCPYCEVFPFSTNVDFSVGALERGLATLARGGLAERFPGETVRDLCLSGSGEPSLSPWLEGALAAACRARASFPAYRGASIVVITNGTRLGDPAVAGILRHYSASEGLVPWVKLDSGDQAGFEAMSGSDLSLSDIVAGIASFAASSPILIQSMLLVLDGSPPDPAELERRWALVSSLALGGAMIRGLQLYTKARPSPGGRTAPLADDRLAALASDAARALPGLPVMAYGSLGPVEFDRP